jgi:nucleotide-binding universal stress UspA family protein
MMRILVAVDGSASADLAVRQVASARWPPGTAIHVLEVIAEGAALIGGPWPGMPPVDLVEVEDELRLHAQRIVADAEVRLAKPRLSVQGDIRVGRTASTIVEQAGALGVDLVVVGSRGHGALASMLLGSVSAEVIDHAPAPVWVARRPSLERVALAWDGSSCAARAAGLLTRWPIFAGTAVRVVSVADTAASRWMSLASPEGIGLAGSYEEAAEPSRTQHEQLARDMAERLREAGLDAEADRRDGDPATQIVNAAHGWGADLIVVGTHGRTGLTRLLLGSVARNVLHHAGCSVLVVRATA